MYAVGEDLVAYIDFDKIDPYSSMSVPGIINEEVRLLIQNEKDKIDVEGLKGLIIYGITRDTKTQDSPQTVNVFVKQQNLKYALLMYGIYDNKLVLEETVEIEGSDEGCLMVLMKQYRNTFIFSRVLRDAHRKIVKVMRFELRTNSEGKKVLELSEEIPQEVLKIYNDGKVDIKCQNQIPNS